MRRFFFTILMFSITVSSYQPLLAEFDFGIIARARAAELSAKTELTERLTTLPEQESRVFERETTEVLLDQATANAKELAILTDFLKKNVRLSPTDRRFLEDWRKIRKELEDQPELLAEFDQTGELPASIRKQFGLDKRQIPNFDRQLLDLLANLMADPETGIFDVEGFGHEFMDISRLVKDHQSDKRAISEEGIEKPAFKEIEDEIISAHSLRKAQAADIAALDYLRCTQITYKPPNDQEDPLKIIKKKKLPTKEIEFKWQAEEPSDNLLSTRPDGVLDPNSLGQLFGSNLDSFLRGVSQGELLRGFDELLGGGGFPLDIDEITKRISAWGGGTATNLPDLFDILGQDQFTDLVAGSRRDDLIFGTDLGDTAQKIGSALLAGNLAGMPSQTVASDTLDGWADNLARATLGERLTGTAGFVWEGTTADELWTNIGAQYLVSEIFGLGPTTALRELPSGSPQELKQSIGRIGLGQKLGVALDQITTTNRNAFLEALGSRVADPALVDHRLGLAKGITARLTDSSLGSPLSPDQYAELVGQAIFDATLNAYASDEARNRAFGAALIFNGPEDFYLPDPTIFVTVDERLAEIDRVYRQQAIGLIDEAEWTAFQTFYRDLYKPSSGIGIGSGTPLGASTSTTAAAGDNVAGTSGDADKTRQVQNRLLAIANDSFNLAGTVANGALETATYRELGERVVARALTPRTFLQFALFDYLAAPDHQVLVGRIKSDHDPAGEYFSPVFDPDALAAERLGLAKGDLGWIVGDQFETAVLPRLATDLFAAATGNEPPQPTFWTDEFLTENLETIASTLESVAGKTDLGTYLVTLTPTDWQETGLVSDEGSITRDQRIQEILASVARDLAPMLDEANPADRDLLRTKFAALAAGRDLPDIESFLQPEVRTNRRLGITADLIDQLWSGELTPKEAAETLGARTLAYVFEADDMDAMSEDLAQAIGAGRAGSAEFFEKYEEHLTDLAANFSASLDLPGVEITPQHLFGAFAGNRLPLYDLAGQTFHQNLTGLQGSIFKTEPADLTKLMGARNLLGAAGLGGTFDLATNPLDLIPEGIFEQWSGIDLADSASGIVEANGPYLLAALNAPRALKDQFKAIWDSGDLTQALNFVSDGNFWQSLPSLQKTFGSMFGGDLGGQFGSTFQSIFTGDGTKGDLFTLIRGNIESFFPADIESAVGFSFDQPPFFAALKANNLAGLLGSFDILGQNVLGETIPGFGNLSQFFAGLGNFGQAQVNFGFGELGNMFGGAFNNLAGQFSNFFQGGLPLDLSGLLGAAGDLQNIFKDLPLANILQLGSDLKGFNLGLISNFLATDLKLEFPDLSKVLMGIDFGEFLDLGKLSLDGLLGDVDLGGFLKGLAPGDLQGLLGDLVGGKADALLSLKSLDVGFRLFEKQLGLPEGVSGLFSGFLSGSGEVQIGSFLEGAKALLPDLGGEAGKLLDGLIGAFNGGNFDFGALSGEAFSLLNNELSGLIGGILPSNFTSFLPDLNLFGGSLNLDGFLGNFDNFSLGQLSGVLDGLMDVDFGTFFNFQEAFGGIQDMFGQIDLARLDLFGNIGNLDLSNVLGSFQLNLASLQGAAIGMLSNLVFGEMFQGFESALGLPAGTVSQLFSGGIAALLGGGGMIGVLGAAMPILAAAGLFANVLGLNVGGIFGGGLFGGSGPITEVVCTPGGYFPYITPEDDKKAGLKEEEIALIVYDPNPNLDRHTDLKQRLKREEVKEKLALAPGYPGEFLGEQTQAQEYELGKKASARWKIRQLIGETLTACDRFDILNPEVRTSAQISIYQASQIIAFEIPPGQRSTKPEFKQDGDYLAPYLTGTTETVLDGEDPQFLAIGDGGGRVGKLDASFDQCGYGDGTAGSMQRLHVEYPVEYSRGLWVEGSDEYWEHVHIGF